MFMNARSLRQLNVAHNHLTVLPGVVENCALEYLNISNNKIERLPSELFKTAHRYVARTTPMTSARSSLSGIHIDGIRLSGIQRQSRPHQVFFLDPDPARP